MRGPTAGSKSLVRNRKSSKRSSSVTRSAGFARPEPPSAIKVSTTRPVIGCLGCSIGSAATTWKSQTCRAFGFRTASSRRSATRSARSRCFSEHSSATRTSPSTRRWQRARSSSTRRPVDHSVSSNEVGSPRTPCCSSPIVSRGTGSSRASSGACSARETAGSPRVWESRRM